MAQEFLLPQLSESVTEGEILKWLVKPGDTVKADQPLVEIMTDKVTVELPSPHAGTIEKLLVKEGDVVPMKAPILTFADGGATSPPTPVASSASAATTTAPAPAPTKGTMSREFLLPQLSESVTEGEILKWLVKPGDTVKADQPLVEIMTDKVTVELPSPHAGTIEKLLVKEGDVVAMKAPILLFAGESSAAPAAPTETKPVAGGTVSATESAVSGSYGAKTSSAKIDFSSVGKAAVATTSAVAAGTNKFGRALAVPAARKLARERGLDVANIPGSGPNGRVGVDDVRNFKNAPATPKNAPATGGGLPVPPVQYKTPKGFEALEERLPLRGMRRIIANTMQASHLYTVRTLTVDEVDFTRLVELRGRLKASTEAQGVKLTYLPFIFKAVTRALKEFPNVNSSIDEATGEIVRKHYYNIGCAVDTDGGLVVPVIKNVDQKSILEVARGIGEIAGRAREGKASPEDMSGSSFSVTNIGSAGSLLSFPIINVPDAAILGVHTIVERPVVIAGQIVIRSMMYLSLSFDHRLIDGAEGARFVKRVKTLLEDPEALMLEI